MPGEVCDGPMRDVAAQAVNLSSIWVPVVPSVSDASARMKHVSYLAKWSLLTARVARAGLPWPSLTGTPSA